MELKGEIKLEKSRRSKNQGMDNVRRLFNNLDGMEA